MNYRNYRLQETARLKYTAQSQISQTQVYASQSNHIHGYRSLGFYQGGREIPAASTSFIVGAGNGNGNLVS